jgi:succinate-semialdehyde dehydrogenase / glutarate-semialdehyde dehydrogenase
MMQPEQLKLQRPDLLRDKCLVAGVWIADDAGRTISVEDPASQAVVANVPNLGASQALAAVAAAQGAFPAWAALPAASRSEVIRRWYALILTHAEDLARIVTLEHGKPLKESRAEVAYAASFLAWFAEEGKRSYGEIVPSPLADRRILTLRQPVGVCAAITPWNFPLAMITRKVGPALAAGCTMVLKPAEQTSLSALALAVLGEEAGIPSGVLNVITGDPEPIGDVLTSDPRVRKLTFTGSTAIGSLLMAKSAPTVKRLSLELGGNAPLLVLEDADIDVAVEGALQAKFRNGGQSCVGANRFYVVSEIYDTFVERFAARVVSMRVGNGFDPSSDVGPLIDDAAVHKVRRHVEDAVSRGARVVAGGDLSPAGGRFWQPTVLADVPRDALAAREETFGPVAPIIRVSGTQEAVALANDTEFGLAAYLFSRDLGRIWSVAEALEVGMLGVNTGLISSEVAPFGGVKQSGLGREGSRHGLDEYLEIKYVCLAGVESVTGT